MEKTAYAPGMLSWTDLSTTDTAAAKKFYGELFDWTHTDSEHEGKVIYTLFDKGGKHVAGLGELQPEQRSAGVPPHWMTYVAVENVDATVEAVAANGGKVLMPGMDIFDAGRMAVFADPEGVVFSIWQAKQHIGSQLRDEPGTQCWNELCTRNPDGAAKFYSAVFGWSFEQMEMPHMKYTVIKVGDAGQGGILEMVGDEWKDIPAHWMTYFATADCTATAEKVTALGGTVKVAPFEVPTVGHISVLSDPQGAVFSVIQMQQPAPTE